MKKIDWGSLVITIVLALIMSGIFYAILKSNSKHQEKIDSQIQEIPIENITENMKEVCINGVVYYKPKNGYFLTPKIVLEDRPLTPTGYYGLYEKCPRS